MNIFRLLPIALICSALSAQETPPITYPYEPYHQGQMDPQITGWPLSAEGHAWAIRPRDQRRPGDEVGNPRLELIPVVPSAGRWKDPEKWLNLHSTLVEIVRSQQKPVDVVLLGDSITWMWGGTKTGNPKFEEAWTKRFSHLNTVNLGIQGDTTENILWRLDHGALDGIDPQVIVLLIGTNNKPNAKTQSAVAEGIRLILDNLQKRLPKTRIILVKTLPVATEDMRRFCDYLDTLNFDQRTGIQVLDLWEELVLPDGTIDRDQYIDGSLHLGAGYEIYADKLQPLMEKALKP
jgi:lysophospholipase L1-like esterase